MDTVHSDKLYYIWKAMIDRCYNSNNNNYKNYGERVIKVCDEWDKSYPSFKKWALENGYNYSLNSIEQSIDRIDVNGNYEPDNCRWVDMKTQIRNRRKSIKTIFRNKEISIAELAENYNISYETIRQRYNRGVRGEALINKTQKREKQTYYIHGEYLTIRDISGKYGVSKQDIKNRIKNNSLNELFVGF